MEEYSSRLDRRIILVASEKKWLKELQDKLVSKVIPFYKYVEKTYFTPAGSIDFDVRNEKARAEKLAYDIEKLRVAGKGRQTEITELYNRAADIYDDFHKIEEFAEDNIQFNEHLYNVRRQSGIDLKRLSKDAKVVLSRIENLGRREKKEEESYFPTKASEWAWTAAYSIPPIGIAAKSAWELAKALRIPKGLSLAKDALSRSFSKRPAAPKGTETILPSIPDEPYTSSISAPSNISQRLRNAQRVEEYTRHGERYKQERGRTGRFGRMVSSPKMLKDSERDTYADTEQNSISMGLFKFFNSPQGAYKAKWTKELLEAIQGGGPKKSWGGDQTSGGTNIFPVPPGVSSFVTKAASVVLGIGAAYLGLKRVAEDISSVTKEGRLTDVPGKHLTLGQQAAAAFGGGPGIGQKGAIKNIVSGLGTGALLGASAALIAAPFTGGMSLAALPIFLGGGVTLGAGIMGAGHAIGSERFQNLWRTTPLGSLGFWQEKRIEEGKIPKKATLKDLEIIDFMKASGGGFFGLEQKYLTRDLNKVPLSDSQVNAQNDIKDGLDKVYNAINDVNNTLKDNSKNVSKKLSSGTDTNSTRNPVISSLGAGQLDIA